MVDSNFSTQNSASLRPLPPLPPKPEVQVKSLFQADANLVNSFPEAESAPLKYGYAPPSQPHPPLAEQQTSQPNFVQPQVYYTPPQHGYVAPVAQVFNPKPLTPTVNRKFIQAVTVFSYISLAIMILILFVFFSTLTGAVGAISTIVLASISFVVIFLSLNWIGKWDPEPFGLKLFAFLYGAAGSVILTFMLGAIWAIFLGEPDIVVGATFQAPITEEFAKGIGIFIMLIFFRKHIDGPIDGLVFMALIGAGFAFTENILYYSEAFLQGGAIGLSFIFFNRGVLSPFAHVIFSIPMGIAVGWAVAKQFSVIKMVGVWFLAYLLGMLLHGIWNGTAVTAASEADWYIFYILIQVPIFIIAIGVAVWLRRREATLTYQILAQYAHMGWFTPPEVESFATWDGRRNLVKWAKQYAPQKLHLVEDLAKDVVDLVHVREKINANNIKRTPKLVEEENDLLHKIQAKKQMIVS